MRVATVRDRLVEALEAVGLGARLRQLLQDVGEQNGLALEAGQSEGGRGSPAGFCGGLRPLSKLILLSISGAVLRILRRK